MGMLTLALAVAAHAADAPTPSSPITIERSAPEPVLDLARLDVKALRVARTSQILMVAVPGAMIASAFVAANSAPGSPEGIAGGIGVFTSGLGMLVLSNVFHRRAVKSRKLLVQQGLRVTRTPPVIVPILSLVGFAATSTLAGRIVTVRELGPPTGAATLSAVSFAACFGLGTLQMEWNRIARKKATWITVVPVPHDDRMGLAVVGRW